MSDSIVYLGQLAETIAMTLQRQPNDDLIRFRCVCGKKLKAPREHAGKPAKCSCGARPLVPDDAPKENAADAEIASQWFWRHPASPKQIGPLPESAMRKLLESCKIVRSTMVRRADSDVWAPAESWWEGFSEDQAPGKREQSPALPPDRNDIPLAAPVPSQAPVVVHIATQPSRSRAKESLRTVKYGPSIVANIVMFLVAVWTLICFIGACRVVWVILTDKERAKPTTFEALFFGLGIMVATWVIPTLFGVAVAKLCRLR